MFLKMMENMNKYQKTKIMTSKFEKKYYKTSRKKMIPDSYFIL